MELALTDRMQDLLRREADIAVRMARPRQDLLVARRIGQIEVGLHAHERYLSRHGTPRALADLANHALIGFDQMTGFIRSAGKVLSGWRREDFALRTDSNLAQLALIGTAPGSACARRKSVGARRGWSGYSRDSSASGWTRGSPCTRIFATARAAG